MRPTSSPAPRTLDAARPWWAHPLASVVLASSETRALHSETHPRGRRGPRWRPEVTLVRAAEDSRTIPEMRMVT